jgi:hypothetical protein
MKEDKVSEEYERIRKDQRYEKLFEPKKWDVIIRVLEKNEKKYLEKSGGNGKKAEEEVKLKICKNKIMMVGNN